MKKYELLEFKISEDCIDNPLLPSSEIAKYDFDYCFNEVQQKIDNYVIAQSEYPQINKPRITQNYEIRYEMYIPKKIDKVGDYVEKIITKEEEIIQLYSDVAASLTALSKDEFTYFLECIYFRKSNYECRKITNFTRGYCSDLRDSCVIKLAKALGVAKKINEL